ncbi:MAG: M15 family metallopeptidase [Clostridia bacterium]|nr:M15 family metallopeptidase [Clostridia bacterium]
MIRLIALLTVLLSMFSVNTANIAEQMAPDGYLMLVNRQYRLPAAYEPEDLVKPNVRHTSGSILMRKDAAKALELLFAAAKEEAGLTLYAHSGYRSYSTQQAIFQRKINEVKNIDKARLLVADPGASEHQLGLAMDVKGSQNGKLNAAFGKTKEGIWLAENAYRFGFIIRYKEEWTVITGYVYEPWHIRYVGVEHAAIIHELDIPFEEYIESLRLVCLGGNTEESAI